METRTARLRGFSQASNARSAAAVGSAKIRARRRESVRQTRRKATALLAVLQLTAVALLRAQSPGRRAALPGEAGGPRQRLRVAGRPCTRRELEDLLTRLRAATGAEVAVVTLPTIDDHDEAEVALAIGRKWGVGAQADIGDQRRNAGLVLLLVPRVRTISPAPGTSGSRWGGGSRVSSPTPTPDASGAT